MPITLQGRKNMNRNRPAFTIIEVLVAVVIVSMLIVMGLYSFRFAVVEAKKNRSLIPQQAIDFHLLKSMINSTFFYVLEDEGRTPEESKMFYFFKGSAERVTFVTASPLFGKSLSIVTLFMQDGGLVYRESPMYDQAQDFKNPRILSNAPSYTILQDIEALHFSYTAKDKQSSSLNNI